MATYAYKGILEGIYTDGEVEADDATAATAQLKEKKIIITQPVKLSRGRPKAKGAADSKTGSKGFSFDISFDREN